MVQNDDEADRTLWCGNLHEKVTEEILYELFLQAGPLEKVKLVSGSGPRYAFITFLHAVSVPYTIALMNGIRLFDRAVRLQTRNGSGGSTSGSTSAPGTPTHGPGSSGGQMPAAPCVPLLQTPPPNHQMLPEFPRQQTWQPMGSTPSAGFNMQQHSHPLMHRSTSEPECLGPMRHGPGHRGAMGRSAEPWDRTAPYGRSSPRRAELRREFTEPSPPQPSAIVANVAAHLHSLRNAHTPRGTDSNKRWEPAASRHRSGGSSGRQNSSRRYH